MYKQIIAVLTYMALFGAIAPSMLDASGLWQGIFFIGGGFVIPFCCGFCDLRYLAKMLAGMVAM